MAVTVIARPLPERARAYGVHRLIALDGRTPGPEQLQYLDLLPRRSPSPLPVPVSAVAEHQGAALLYLVDDEGGAASGRLQRELPALQRALANRSDPAWLGVIHPGTLALYPIGFRIGDAVPLKIVEARSTAAPMFFQSLVQGTFDGEVAGVDEVYDRIFKLLTQTIDAFVPKDAKGAALLPLDVLSLAGRALFFRFLVDRSIVLPAECEELCPQAQDLKDAFSNATKAASTSAWLDETFNGDFLRLIDERIPVEDRDARRRAYRAFYLDVGRKTDGAIFNHLQAILRGWKYVGETAFQTRFDWDDLNFAHIPIGVLSQVYESFSHRADPDTAGAQSVHYTPRLIARLLVDEAFAALKSPARAVVLDPACGAGIFLALAYRRLVAERWREHGRPTASVLQQILYQQVRGFDVSEPALRLAALTLYITAIELNASPRPPASLKFPRSLRDEVLFRFGAPPAAAPEQGKKRFPFVLGSLGPEVPAHFDKRFDLVVGNPPWTRLREQEPVGRTRKDSNKSGSGGATKALNAEFTRIGQRALRAKGLDDTAKSYNNPDNDPDLPFFWRATEWAKPDEGLIAFAMPARIFQRTTGPGAKVWGAMLSATTVTGLVNFADVRKTSVWEGIDVPYCLLYARNARSTPDHAFYYATPAYEREMNSRGRFRIDYEATRPVTVGRASAKPWTLKALSLGTWRDVETVEQILNAFPENLKQVWDRKDPSHVRTGKGYDLSPGLDQNPDTFLGGMEVFQRLDKFAISSGRLRLFRERYARDTAHMPRSSSLYQPPVVIVPQSPGQTKDAPRAYLARRALAFSQSYYGYSCAGHPQQEVLAALLYLLPHSTLFAYFSLMTSRRVGADRQTFNKEELDALPFPEVASLDAPTQETIVGLARRLEEDASKPWKEINHMIFRLYGLDDAAITVIRDTLFAAASYREAGRRALLPPRKNVERLAFRAELQALLDPYFAVCDHHVAIEELSTQQDEWRSPWFFLAVGKRHEEVPVDAALLTQAMAKADESAASRILVHAPGHRGLVLGVLSQRRWWTRTRAILCGQHILRHHLDAFGLSEDV